MLINVAHVINPTQERLFRARKLLSKARLTEAGCIEWTGAKDSNGYGNLYFHSGKVAVYDWIRAHRISYELFVGPVPEGLHLDHLCRNHLCFNPLHLEAVTAKENALRGISPNAMNARKTHCVRGHEFTVENTRIDRNGFRQCRACDKVRWQHKYARIKARTQR